MSGVSDTKWCTGCAQIGPKAVEVGDRRLFAQGGLEAVQGGSKAVEVGGRRLSKEG